MDENKQKQLSVFSEKKDLSLLDKVRYSGKSMDVPYMSHHETKRINDGDWVTIETLLTTCLKEMGANSIEDFILLSMPGGLGSGLSFKEVLEQRAITGNLFVSTVLLLSHQERQNILATFGEFWIEKNNEVFPEAYVEMFQNLKVNNELFSIILKESIKQFGKSNNSLIIPWFEWAKLDERLFESVNIPTFKDLSVDGKHMSSGDILKNWGIFKNLCSFILDIVQGDEKKTTLLKESERKFINNTMDEFVNNIDKEYMVLNNMVFNVIQKEWSVYKESRENTDYIYKKITKEIEKICHEKACVHDMQSVACLFNVMGVDEESLKKWASLTSINIQNQYIEKKYENDEVVFNVNPGAVYKAIALARYLPNLLGQRMESNNILKKLGDYFPHEILKLTTLERLVQDCDQSQEYINQRKSVDKALDLFYIKNILADNLSILLSFCEKNDEKVSVDLMDMNPDGEKFYKIFQFRCKKSAESLLENFLLEVPFGNEALINEKMNVFMDKYLMEKTLSESGDLKEPDRIKSTKKKF